MRNMAVCPHRLLSRGRTSWIKEALLGKQYKGPLRMLILPHGTLTSSNFRQCAAYVYSSSACAYWSLPWNWTVEGKIKLKYADTVAIAFELLFVSARQGISCNAQQLPRCHIEQYG